MSAAAGKDVDDLDALQDSSTHSFTDVCAASAFFNCATQKISPLHTTLVEADCEVDGREQSSEEEAELCFEANFSGKRIEPTLKLLDCPEVLTRTSSAPVAVSKEPCRKEPFRLSRHLSSSEEKEWAAKISAAKAEICMLCLVLLGIACSNL
jgi:hypothetical protein